MPEAIGHEFHANPKSDKVFTDLATEELPLLTFDFVTAHVLRQLLHVVALADIADEAFCMQGFPAFRTAFMLQCEPVLMGRCELRTPAFCSNMLKQFELVSLIPSNICPMPMLDSVFQHT